jgi:hypothetical protein
MLFVQNKRKDASHDSHLLKGRELDHLPGRGWLHRWRSRARGCQQGYHCPEEPEESCSGNGVRLRTLWTASFVIGGSFFYLFDSHLIFYYPLEAQNRP